jgi:hypothetical protein
MKAALQNYQARMRQAETVSGVAAFSNAPLMSGEADRAAFETASSPAASNSAEFALIAKMAAFHFHRQFTATFGLSCIGMPACPTLKPAVPAAVLCTLRKNSGTM